VQGPQQRQLRRRRRRWPSCGRPSRRAARLENTCGWGQVTRRLAHHVPPHPMTLHPPPHRPHPSHPHDRLCQVNKHHTMWRALFTWPFLQGMLESKEAALAEVEERASSCAAAAAAVAEEAVGLGKCHSPLNGCRSTHIRVVDMADTRQCAWQRFINTSWDVMLLKRRGLTTCVHVVAVNMCQSLEVGCCRRRRRRTLRQPVRERE